VLPAREAEAAHPSTGRQDPERIDPCRQHRHHRSDRNHRALPQWPTSAARADRRQGHEDRGQPPSRLAAGAAISCASLVRR